jgi:hypothetical protein
MTQMTQVTRFPNILHFDKNRKMAELRHLRHLSEHRRYESESSDHFPDKQAYLSLFSFAEDHFGISPAE